MSFQQIRGVMSLPPDPPRTNNDNNNYICTKYCPKGLDHLNFAFKQNPAVAGLFSKKNGFLVGGDVYTTTRALSHLNHLFTAHCNRIGEYDPLRFT